MRNYWISSLLFIAACSNESPAVPQEQATSASSTHVTVFSEQAIKNSGIEMATAAAGTVHETVQVYGVVQPKPDRVREVVARYPGVIRSVAHAIGDAVRAGEVLATVESNDSLQTYNVTAPIAGVITQRRANTGENANDQSLFSIADYSQVFGEFSVFPRDRSNLRIGQEAQVSDAQGAHKVTGRVAYIASGGNSINQSVMVRVQLDNAQHIWTPGQFVNGELVISQRSVSIAIPVETIQQIKGSDVIFVQNSQGAEKRFETRPVKLGKSGAGIVEVLQGLNAGERYVTKNSYVVKAEALKSEAEEE